MLTVERTTRASNDGEEYAYAAARHDWYARIEYELIEEL